MHRFRVGRLMGAYGPFADPPLPEWPTRLRTSPKFVCRYPRRSRRFAARRFFAAFRFFAAALRFAALCFLAALAFFAFAACRSAVARSSAAVFGVKEPIEEKPVT